MLLILCAAISLIFTGALVTYAVLETVTYGPTNVFQSDKNIRINWMTESNRISVGGSWHVRGTWICAWAED